MSIEQIIAKQEEEFKQKFGRVIRDTNFGFNEQDGELQILNWYSSSIKEILEGHFKTINSILNKHSKSISEGGLDYVKAFEEMEKYEDELLSIIKQLK